MNADTDSPPVYPAALRLAGRRVVVVGGGPVAQRRVLGLLDARADVLVVAPEVTPAIEALADGGPGDPDLITVRGRRLLAEADVVVADRLGPRGLLDELAPDVEIIDASKIPYGRALAQEAINEVLIARAKAGKFVVRLKGGDPFVFGRGFEELLACAEAGVPCSVVPGITSSVSVPALAGIPVTHRGVAHEFTVVSGHVAPDHPKSLVDWTALGRMTGTLVILMGIERIAAIAAALIANGRDPETPVAVIQEGTMPGERRLLSLPGLPRRRAAQGPFPPAAGPLDPHGELGAHVVERA